MSLSVQGREQTMGAARHAGAGALHGRFGRLRRLRGGPAFERYAAFDEERNEPCLLIVGARSTSVADARARLDETARVLRLLDHPQVPKVVARARLGEAELLALSCDAVDDLERTWAHHASTGTKLRVEASWALAERCLDVLAHAHQRVDPLTGRPVCMRGFSWSNVLVSAQGDPFLLGFGDDLLSPKGELTPGLVRAPEVALGVAPTRGADLWALLTLFHSLLPVRELPVAVERVLTGRPQSSDASVQARLRALHASILLGPEQRTQDAAWVKQRYGALWAELGVTADLDAFRATVVAARAGRDAVRADPPRLTVAFDAAMDASCKRPTLHLVHDGSAFRVDGSPAVDMSRRHIARRLLRALAEHALAADGSALSTYDLLEAGWPGERMCPEAGAHRVHVALHQLRKLGLADLLVRGEHGYELRAHVSLSEPPEPNV